MSYNPVNLADEVYRELSEPSDTTVSEITFWFRTNLGQLNNLIGTEYVIDDSTNNFFISGTGPGNKEGVILKELYKCHYYTKSINANLGASAYTAVLSVSSDNATVQKINKNEVAKTYLNMKKDCMAYIDTLVKDYTFNTSSTPVQVAGDDDIIEECTFTDDIRTVY